MKASPAIENVERQIQACKDGKQAHIVCPFCEAENHANNSQLCCADFGLVVHAILRKEAQGEVREKAFRLAEAIARN